MPTRHAPSKAESALLPTFDELNRSRIQLLQTEAELAKAASVLTRAEILGFDTESKPVFQAGQTDTGPHLVQLATLHDAWLIPMHLPQAAQLVRTVLANPAIAKVGFGLANDKQQLQRLWHAELHQIIDLDQHFSRLGYVRNLGVRAAVALVLGQSLTKSKRLSTSNWARNTLSEAQIRYAANDTHAAACVYAALAQWQANRLTSPQTSAPAPAKP